MTAQPTLADLDVSLLEQTFEAVKPRGSELVAEFYRRLFETHPEVRPMFAKADMAEQQGKLLSALALVVANLKHGDVLVPALQQLGSKHVGYGVAEEQYDVVGATLLASLAHVAGPAWTSEAEAAWRDAYTVAAGVMKAAPSGA